MLVWAVAHEQASLRERVTLCRLMLVWTGLGRGSGRKAARSGTLKAEHRGVQGGRQPPALEAGVLAPF